MHVGPDANHGHYIAHIQELETGNWFKFSDEHVVALDKKSYSQQAEDTSCRLSHSSIKSCAYIILCELTDINKTRAYMDMVEGYEAKKEERYSLYIFLMGIYYAKLNTNEYIFSPFRIKAGSRAGSEEKSFGSSSLHILKPAPQISGPIPTYLPSNFGLKLIRVVGPVQECHPLYKKVKKIAKALNQE